MAVWNKNKKLVFHIFFFVMPKKIVKIEIIYFTKKNTRIAEYLKYAKNVHEKRLNFT